MATTVNGLGDRLKRGNSFLPLSYFYLCHKWHIGIIQTLFENVLKRGEDANTFGVHIGNK